MHVDRSRFLFLTASLAAAACNQPRPAAGPDTGDAEPVSANQGSGQGSGQGSSTRSSDGEPSGTEPGGPSVWLEIEPGTEDADAVAFGADCDNSVGRPGACSLSAPSSHCESFDSTVRLCDSFSGFMQPRAAEAAVDCLQAASGTQKICDWQIWNQCTSAGLQATCVEPATRSECDSISSQCGGSIDVFSCQQALSAVRPRHIGSLASCVREFCEIPFCVTDLGSF